MTRLTFRLATAADIPAAAAAHIESCLDAYRGLAPDEVVDGIMPKTLRRLWDEERLTGGDFILLAEDEGEVVGLATVRAKETPYIDHFHVRPARKGTGVGRAMLGAAFDELRRRGEREVYLDVLKTNEAAMAFYRAMGGEIGETITGDLFGHPTEAVVVRWREL